MLQTWSAYVTLVGRDVLDGGDDGPLDTADDLDALTDADTIAATAQEQAFLFQLLLAAGQEATGTLSLPGRRRNLVSPAQRKAMVDAGAELTEAVLPVLPQWFANVRSDEDSISFYRLVSDTLSRHAVSCAVAR